MRKHLPRWAGGRNVGSRKFARNASCSNAGSDVPRVTRLNGGAAAAPLVCTRRQHGAEPVISEAFPVEFCHSPPRRASDLPLCKSTYPGVQEAGTLCHANFLGTLHA